MAEQKKQPQELPPIQTLDAAMAQCGSLPPVIIPGFLRRGRKMLIAGSSKSGKSLLLMELCVAMAEGGKWLDIAVPRGKVIYVNFEIAADSLSSRFDAIYSALKIAPQHKQNILVWNLRGFARPLDKIVDAIIERVKEVEVGAVILDPIYKIITGDENSATDMGKFANQIDRICTETGAAVIFCHHHSKGSQTAKKAIDRASGSGVFARDPDAVVDVIEIPGRRKGASLWRLTAALREFAEPEPIIFEFEYPLHTRVYEGAHTAPDVSGVVAALGAEPTLKDYAKKTGVSEPTARSRLLKAGFSISRGRILPPDSH